MASTMSADSPPQELWSSTRPEDSCESSQLARARDPARLLRRVTARFSRAERTPSSFTILVIKESPYSSLLARSSPQRRRRHPEVTCHCRGAGLLLCAAFEARLFISQTHGALW